MNTLPFTIIISIIIHVLIFINFSKYSNVENYNTTVFSSASYVEVSIIEPAKDGKSTAEDNTGSDDASQKNEKSENNERQTKSVIGEKNKKKNNRQSITKSAKAGQDGYNQKAYTAGYANYIPRPNYPLVSRRNKEEGTVVFNILLDENGGIIEYKIKKSSGYKRLDKQAEKSIKAAKFQPALQNGKPIQSQLELKITFTLEGK